MVRKARKVSAVNEKKESLCSISVNAAANQPPSWKRWLMDFEVELDQRLHRLDLKVKGEIESLDRTLMVILNTIPPHEAKLPPPQRNIDTCDVTDNSLENAFLLNPRKGHTGIVTSTVSKPHQKIPPESSQHSRTRTRNQRSKSACEDIKEPQLSRPRTRSSSQNRTQIPQTVTKYQTPSYKGNRTVQMVTPKVDPYCPMPLKRFARQGEMAISLEGSPLMITTNISEPNICLPVNNGQEVYSIMPSEGPCPSLPQLDHNTKEKLRILRQNLDQILGDAFKK